MTRIEDVRGIGPALGRTMRAAGIRSAAALLRRASSQADREEVAAVTGIAAETILACVNRADLMRIKGIGSEYAELLEAAGVETVKELRNHSPRALAATLAEVNDNAIRTTKRSLVRRTPAVSEVERWITAALLLDQVVTR